MLDEGIWKWGADIILQIQHWGLPVLPFELVTFLGNEAFYFVLVPILYWFVRPAAGIRILLLLLFSAFTNSFVKLALTQPRPYWVSSEIKGYVFESSYGIPSGHSQNAVTIWGYLASILRSGRPWVIPLAVLLIAVICFSRMVLGVHFPQDIIGGLILGGVVLFVFMRSIDSILGWYESLSTGRKIGYSLVVSWILIALAVILRSLLNHEDPDTWKIMATLAEGVDVSDVASLKKAFDPRSLDLLITIAGSLAGVGVSLALSERSNHFKIVRKPASYVGIFLLGFIGLVLFRELPKKIFPFEDEIPAGIVRYGRYFITMIWAVYWAPILFKSLGWAEPLPENEMKSFLRMEKSSK